MNYFQYGKEIQELIIAAKPDWTLEKWEQASEEIQASMEPMRNELEKLRGRLYAIGTHMINQEAKKK